jgi:hypothetical protein
MLPRRNIKIRSGTSICVTNETHLTRRDQAKVAFAPQQLKRYYLAQGHCALLSPGNAMATLFYLLFSALENVHTVMEACVA